MHAGQALHPRGLAVQKARRWRLGGTNRIIVAVVDKGCAKPSSVGVCGMLDLPASGKYGRKVIRMGGCIYKYRGWAEGKKTN